MGVKLKGLDQQVIVITGATSGIGLVTARAAARRGARLVLAARNEQVLRDLCDEIKAKGGEAIYVVADVGRQEDVRRISEAAIRQFGGFDTWVNGAAVSIYGDVEDVTIEDQRRLFDTNYWGVVYGSRIAADQLRERGGAIVNIGSVLSDRAIPVQGVYSASKSAVKAFTAALRMELERDGAPVSVSLIKPSAVDTPYMRHAKNYLPVAPKNPPPIYSPNLVADAILQAAEHPVRDIVVGGGGRLISTLGMMFPRLTDKVMERTMTWLQQSEAPSAPREENNLYEPREDGHERSRYSDQHVFERSLYTRARLHPVATGLVALGIGAAAAAALRSRPSRR